MPNLQTINIESADTWVEHRDGRIFTRIWTAPTSKNLAIKQPPIVLFHDSLGCVDLWRDFPAELTASTGRNVIAYDRLGFGKSDPRCDALTIDFIEDEAKTYFSVIREQLGIHEFVAFGHSVGGGMAIHCAANFAADCEALITESAQAFTENRTLKAIAAAKEQFKDHKQLERLKKYHGEKAEWVVNAWTGTWLSSGFASWSLADVLWEVISPVLALHGDHDEYGSNRHPEMIGLLCSGPATVKIITDTYHVPHRERPEVIAGLVYEFLSNRQTIRLN
jgi:pimeloyl-ACP methyl ester carboxylesterase